MSALDPRPADARDARRDGSEDVAYNQGDVTEGWSIHADFYAVNDRLEWRCRVVRLSLWLFAGAISLLANAELFTLLAHREVGETNAGPAQPDAVMVDLPAAETAPAEPARPDAKPDTPAETPTKIPADASDEAPRTATREPEAPAPPDAATPPDEAAPAAVIPSAPAPDSWSAAPLPVPRPRRYRPAAVVPRAGKPPPSRRIVRAAALRALHAGAVRREARLATGSPFAGAASAADWKSQVVAALNRAKRYPDGTEAAGWPTIRMIVAASGDVARVAIVASSGSSALDTAAIETVRRTSPLPPPPGGATDLTFRMYFHLRTP